VKIIKLELLRIISHINSRQRRRRNWIHEINREGELLGELYTLFSRLLEGNKRDIFVMERTGTPFQKFFIGNAQAFRNFFPGIGTINTTPLRRNFGPFFASITFFKRKIALVLYLL
jgi:hypothetical protein